VDIRYSPFLGHPLSVLEFTPGASFSVSLPGVLCPENKKARSHLAIRVIRVIRGLNSLDF
jgi:hypothetical protein